jgi:8-oxo-dGTP pyrophosphatase MutT (NUDIX family)
MKIDSFLHQIKQSLSNPLPGIESHKLLTPGKRPLVREEVPQLEEYRQSAVAVICFPIKDTIHSLLIQRPNYNGNHGGQISFPGGKMDLTDFSLEHTARRETFEEIGWKLSENNYLGKLTELFIPVSKFCVQPYLYFCEEMQPFHPDTREVEEIIYFPLEELKQEATIKNKNIRISSGLTLKDVPYFDIDKRVVWGATAIILSELREMIR